MLGQDESMSRRIGGLTLDQRILVLQLRRGEKRGVDTRLSQCKLAVVAPRARIEDQLLHSIHFQAIVGQNGCRLLKEPQGYAVVKRIRVELR